MPLRNRQGRRRAADNEQRPLQDITESFDRQAVYPSSLPPSSPLPGSTPSRVVSSEAGDLALDHEDNNDENAENIPILPFKLGDHPADAENPFMDSAFSPQPTDIEPEPPEDNDVDMTLSDPFGFVAVERKLKAARANLPPSQLVPERVERPETPKPSTSPIQIDTPPTPFGTRSIHVSVDEDGEGDIESMASPSPKKRRAKGKRKQSEPEDPKKLADTLRARLPPRKAAKRVRAQEPESTDEEPPRRVTRSSKRRKKEPEEEEEEEPAPPKRMRKKPLVNGKKKEDVGPSAGRPARKSTQVAEEECDDSEGEHEAQARQRQERIDYFKKLDKYKLHQERVYVV